MATKLTPENDLNACGCKSSELPPDHNVSECIAKAAYELKESDAKAASDKD